MCHHQAKGILVCLCQHRPRHAARHPPHCCVICSFLLEDSRREPQILIHEISTRTSAATSKKERIQEKHAFLAAALPVSRSKPSSSMTCTRARGGCTSGVTRHSKQLQNPKPFVITVARIPPIYLCTSAASGGHRYTRCPFVRCGGEWCRSED